LEGFERKDLEIEEGGIRERGDWRGRDKRRGVRRDLF
jgi:hypothetical protein